jgi:hypothetical protein
MMSVRPTRVACMMLGFGLALDFETNVVTLRAAKDEENEERLVLVQRDVERKKWKRGLHIAFNDPYRPTGGLEVGTIRATEREWVDMYVNGMKYRELVPRGHIWVSKGDDAPDQEINMGVVEGSVPLVFPGLWPPVRNFPALDTAIRRGIAAPEVPAAPKTAKSREDKSR